MHLNPKNQHISAQFIRFCLIGLCAAAIHVTVVIILEKTRLALAWSNLAGFGVAFWMSYFGHRYFTFTTSNAQHRQMMFRFLMVACSGFLLNEALVLSLKEAFHLPTAFSVLTAIGFSSVFTFLLNRIFAFQPEG